MRTAMSVNVKLQALFEPDTLTTPLKSTLTPSHLKNEKTNRRVR